MVWDELMNETGEESDAVHGSDAVFCPSQANISC